MISIEIQGLAALTRRLDAAGKQSRYAAAVALTRTAQDVEGEMQRDMEGAFDAPSPWISKRGTFVRRADKATLTAIVGIKDAQALYVKEHYLAGARGQKPYERALSGMGLLPAGYRAVPGAGLKLDARGIPNRTHLRELFGSLASRLAVAKGRGQRVRLEGYFAVPTGTAARLHPGIWWRTGRQIKPVLLFVQQARYRKVMDLPRTAQRVVAARFDPHFADAFKQAMATAR